MKTAHASIGWMVSGLALAVAMTGCQTTPKMAVAPPEPEPTRVVAAPFDFTPQHFMAPIRTGDVRYRMLYAPESHAIWITDEVDEMKLDSDVSQGIAIDDDLRHTARIADARFMVIECRLESAFADSSVAYDVVGLRNVDAYLLTPSGERIYPVQRIMAPHADETSQGALIRFGRTTVLVFPKTDLINPAASPISGAPSVRLVLDGFHSQFHFEWQNADQSGLLEVSDTGARSTSALDAVRTGYTSIYSLLSPLQRIVD